MYPGEERRERRLKTWLWPSRDGYKDPVPFALVLSEFKARWGGFVHGMVARSIPKLRSSRILPSTGLGFYNEAFRTGRFRALSSHTVRLDTALAAGTPVAAQVWERPPGVLCVWAPVFFV